MKTLIIGYGEIGKSLEKVLSKKYEVYVRDVELIPDIQSAHVMHVCFPYSKKFVREVKKYQKWYKPKYTIIHSTVPIGTSNKCNAYYSPVRGVHPHLEESLKTFVKYFAPKNRYLKNYFTHVGIPIEEADKRETLEVMKLYCTTLYGLNVIAEKEIWTYCKKHDLDFDLVYTKCNQTYNEGYKKLGFPQYSKYVLNHSDGKIGGHCIIPNCYLLDTDIAKFILNQNNKYPFKLTMRGNNKIKKNTSEVP
jgi:hypothetical protein